MTDHPERWFWLVFNGLVWLANLRFVQEPRKQLRESLGFLLLQRPHNQAQMDIRLSSLPQLDWQQMQLEPVFEPFEQQFNLPTCSIELHHILGRPALLGKGGADDHHSRPPSGRQISLRSLFASKAFLLARTGLHGLLARQERNDQTNLKTLLVLGIPDPTGCATRYQQASNKNLF